MGRLFKGFCITAVVVGSTPAAPRAFAQEVPVDPLPAEEPVAPVLSPTFEATTGPADADRESANLFRPQEYGAGTTGTRPFAAERFMKWGPFDILPSISLSGEYDDNITIRSTDEQDDFIWTITPGIKAGLGDYRRRAYSSLTVTYLPSFLIFTDHDENNSIDHFAELSAQYRRPKLSFGVVQTYEKLSGTVVDVGDRVDRNIYRTLVTSDYAITPKTSVGLDMDQSINDYSRGNSYNEWRINPFVDYKWSPKSFVGLGGTLGWVDVRNSPNSSYQDLVARFGYNVTEKLDVRLNVGAEWRDYSQGGVDPDVEPVFGAGLNYFPRFGTSFSLDGYRRNQTSVGSSGVTYFTTGVTATFSQRFLRKYTFRLTSRYEDREYQSSQVGVATNRQEDYFSVGTSVSAVFTARWNASLYYVFRDNDGSGGGNDFTNNQVGLQTTYQF